MRGGVKQSIRNHIAATIFGLAPVTHTMANVLSETAVGYSNSSLNGHSSHEHDPKPGKRAPIQQGESPVGAGNSPKFALFGRQETVPPGLLEKYADILERTVRQPFNADGLWLIRPDGYVALSAASDNWQAVEAYLASVV